MPIKENREYRSMEILRSAEQSEEKNYIVEGYATTFDSPYELYRDGKYINKEQVSSRAFDFCYMDDTIFQYDHQGMVYARTRNNTLRLDRDEHGLKVTADLGSTEASRGVWDAIDKGLIDKMSFAFVVDREKDDYSYEELSNGDVIITRTINKIDRLYDVSAVSFPANEQTSISARSKELFDGEIAKFEAERLHAQEIKEMREAILARLKQEDTENV